MFFGKKGLCFKRNMPKKIAQKFARRVNARLVVMARVYDYNHLYKRGDFISLNEALYMFEKIKYHYKVVGKDKLNAICPSIKDNAKLLAIRIMSLYGYNDKKWETFALELISFFNLELFFENSANTLEEILLDYFEKNQIIKTDFMSVLIHEDVIPKKYIPENEYSKLSRTEFFEHHAQDAFAVAVDNVFEIAKKDMTKYELEKLEKIKGDFFENF